MPLLSDPSELNYNGVTFDIHESRINAKPIYDSSGRATKWVEYEIHVVRGWVTVGPPYPADGTDDVMLDMRRRLAQPAGALVVAGKGYGALSVNGSSTVRDANFGPKPELLSWQPLAGGIGAYIEWKVITFVPECENARYQFATCEFVSTTNREVDQDGYTNLTTKGHIEIPMPRKSVTDRIPPDTVDDYRKFVEPRVLKGFQRMKQTFQPSEDWRRLDFEFRDDQVRAPSRRAAHRCELERFAVGCSGGGLVGPASRRSGSTRTGGTPVPPLHPAAKRSKHKVISSDPAFSRWNCTLSGQSVVPPNVGKSYAQRAFLVLAAQRWRLVEQRGQPGTLPGAGAGGGGAPFFLPLLSIPIPIPNPGGGPASPPAAGRRVVVVPIGFEATNDVVGRGAEFVFRYWTVLRGTLSQHVRALGVFEELPDASWRAGRRVMTDLRVWTVDGPANVVFRVKDQAIIDLCAERSNPKKTKPVTLNPPDGHLPLPVGHGILQVPPLKESFLPPPRLNISGASGDSADKADEALLIPDPGATRLEYFCWLEYAEPQGRYTRHKPLDGKVRDGQGGMTPRA